MLVTNAWKTCILGVRYQSASGSFNPNPGSTPTDRTCSWTCEFTAFEESPEPCGAVAEFAGIDLFVRQCGTHGSCGVH